MYKFTRRFSICVSAALTAALSSHTHINTHAHAHTHTHTLDAPDIQISETAVFRSNPQSMISYLEEIWRLERAGG